MSKHFLINSLKNNFKELGSLGPNHLKWTILKTTGKIIVGTSLASRKTQDFTLQDLSRKTLVARLARQKFT